LNCSRLRGLLFEDVIKAAPELYVLAMEVVVDVVEGLSLITRQRALRVVADESGLIKEGADAAEEGPHAELRDSFAVLERLAHVEDLAVVGRIRVVAELAAAAVKSVLNAPQDDGRVGRQFEVLGGGVCQGGSHQAGGDDEELHCEGWRRGVKELVLQGRLVKEGGEERSWYFKEGL